MAVTVAVADALEALRTGFRGRIIESGDAGYEDARKLYNAILHAAGIRPFPIDFSPILAFAVFGLIERILVGILIRIGAGIGCGIV